MVNRFILVVYVAFILSACNGGGSGSGGNPPTPPFSNIIPLNISISDINGNTLPNNEINVYKIGSMAKYKLIFSNPNSFAVTPPYSGGINSGANVSVDVNWLNANDMNDLPGKNVYGLFYKTSNSDDCFNNTIIQPNQSCAFYSLAFYDFNTTNNKHFSVPISYSFNEIGNVTNSLTVHQCILNQNRWDCSNEQKQGYDKQFIKYTIVSTAKDFPYPTSKTVSGFNYDFSTDGKYSAYCENNGSINTCYHQNVAYDQSNNVLTYSAFSQFTFINSYFSPHAVLSPDGTSFFGAYAGIGEYWEMVNSLFPSNFFGSYSYPQITKGLNNKIFINNSDNTSFYGVYEYDESLNNVDQVRVDGQMPDFIFGATSDGTVLFMDQQFNLKCGDFENQVSSIVNYTSRIMQNFELPTQFNFNTDFRAFMVGDKFYGYQDVILNHVDGKPYTFTGKNGTYLKINVDKNNCSIVRPDLNTLNNNDMTLETGISIHGDFNSGNEFFAEKGGKITQASNSAIGLN